MVTKEALMLLLVLGIVVSVLILGQLASTQTLGQDQGPGAGYGRVFFNVKEKPYDQSGARVSFNVVERGEQ